MMQPLELEWLPGRYAICRLSADAPLPAWTDVSAAGNGSLLCVARTDKELSIVCQAKCVPHAVRAERGFVAMRIVGALDMNMVGVLARLTGALADRQIPTFAISTFDTDYLLLRQEHRSTAETALSTVARFKRTTNCGG